MSKRMILLISMGLMIAACSGGGAGSKKVTLTRANVQFTAGEYETAMDDYVGLIDDEGTPAIVGAGWCAMRLHRNSQADSFFTIASGTISQDGNAGWSFTKWALNDPAAALAKATAVLDANSSFVLSIDTRVTANHLVWIQASSYLQLDNYASCLAKIQILDGAYSLNLNGDPYAVAAALLIKLQSLGVAVGV